MAQESCGEACVSRQLLQQEGQCISLRPAHMLLLLQALQGNMECRAAEVDLVFARIEQGTNWQQGDAVIPFMAAADDGSHSSGNQNVQQQGQRQCMHMRT